MSNAGITRIEFLILIVLMVFVIGALITNLFSSASFGLIPISGFDPLVTWAAHTGMLMVFILALVKLLSRSGKR